ncbi:hypothetical protein MGN70_007137 [Eutypa lata]|nr:hypothetical protein MGN70_007137 [Eutypa lata]
MSAPSYSSRYTDAQVVCESTTRCLVQHLDLPAKKDYPAISGPAWNTANLMSRLQYSRTTPVTWESMHIALEAYHQTLPANVRNRIFVFVGDHATLFDSSISNADWGIAATRNLAFAAAAFSTFEYIIWPIRDIDGHWATAIVHMTKAKPDDATRTHVSQIALIDPLRDATATRRMARNRARVTLVLLQVFKFTIEPNNTRWRNVWVPEQATDADNSSGPRCYWTCKETMRRVLQMYETATVYHESFWNDHSGWFHVDMVRHEIISSHAWVAVEGMNYHGRLAVEGVNRVRQCPKSEWEDAGPLMRPPPDVNPPREPQNPDVPTMVPPDSTKPSEHTPWRPVFALPPRRQPQIHPSFSMKPKDGKDDYDGWVEAPGRRAVWDDPRRIFGTLLADDTIPNGPQEPPSSGLKSLF